MKDLFPVIKPLIQINLAIAVLAGAFIWAMRVQQGEEQAIYQPETHSRQLEEPPDERRQIGENREKIEQLERQIAAYQKQNASSDSNNDESLRRRVTVPQNIAQPAAPHPAPATTSAATAKPTPRDKAKPNLPDRVAPIRHYPRPATQPTTHAIRPNNARASYSASPIIITPPPASPRPLAKSSATSTAPQKPTKPKLSREEAIAYANDIVAGLQVADKKREIRYGSSTYRKTQSAIRALRQGKSLEVAAQKAKVPLSTLEKLIASGKNRPGSSATFDAPIATNSGNRTALRNPAKTGETPRDQSIRYANDIMAGLQVADTKKQIRYGSRTYRKVQTAVALLRQGKSLETAAHKAKVPTETLKQLIAWGANRPGSAAALDSGEITLADPNL